MYRIVKEIKDFFKHGFDWRDADLIKSMKPKNEPILNIKAEKDKLLIERLKKELTDEKRKNQILSSRKAHAEYQLYALLNSHKKVHDKNLAVITDRFSQIKKDMEIKISWAEYEKEILSKKINLPQESQVFTKADAMKSIWTGKNLGEKNREFGKLWSEISEYMDEKDGAPLGFFKDNPKYEKFMQNELSWYAFEKMCIVNKNKKITFSDDLKKQDEVDAAYALKKEDEYNKMFSEFSDCLFEKKFGKQK